eukprot:TRINITY_DN14282_c0_g1_i16.p2 TRINITY_DN14282_c0_g1~~TRINITY_DN14282_c0_g1_i16.p2  ORF type:complete len:143 (+),score=8.89 TRINITY_DN14282_c0_g1_i16:24-431(+)
MSEVYESYGYFRAGDRRKSCAQLKEITLDGTHVTDVSVQAIAASFRAGDRRTSPGCKKYVWIEQMSRMFPYRQIAARCSQLQKIYLSRTKVTDVSVQAAASPQASPGCKKYVWIEQMSRTFPYRRSPQDARSFKG